MLSFAFIPLFLAFVNLAAGLYAGTRSRAAAERIAFLAAGVCLFSYCLLSFGIAEFGGFPDLVQMWIAVFAGGALFAVPALIAVAAVVVPEHRRWALNAVCAIAAAVSLAALIFIVRWGVPPPEAAPLAAYTPPLRLHLVNLCIFLPAALFFSYRTPLPAGTPVIIRRRKKCVTAGVSLCGLCLAAHFFGGAGSFPLLLLSGVFVFTGYVLVNYRFLDAKAFLSRLIFLLCSVIPLFFLHGQLSGAFRLQFTEDLSLAFSLLILVSILLLTPYKSMMQRVTQRVLTSRRDGYQDILKELAQSMVAILDMDQLLEHMANVLTETLEVERMAVFMAEEQSFQARVSRGIAPEAEEELTVSGALIPSDAWRNAGVIFTGDCPRGTDAEALRAALQAVSPELIIPFYFKNDLVGFVALGSQKNGRLYQPEDVAVLRMFGSEAAIAVEHARLYNEAIIDRATKVLNQHYFLARLREEFTRAKRYGRPLALIMLELAQYKDFIRKRGAVPAELLVKNIALLLKTQLRAVDIIGRYAEDCFAVLLPETARRDAPASAAQLSVYRQDCLAVAERLRSSIESFDAQPASGRRRTVPVGAAMFFYDAGDKNIQAEDIVRLLVKTLEAMPKTAAKKHVVVCGETV
ncbi:MAG: diguanylate cyclase [Candidatus Omnitrophica bacterium]|nr:diguanylate cyclase [Candidatus Omnitrophota bacterium]